MVKRVQKSRRITVPKLNYSSLNLEQALSFVPTDNLVPWQIASMPLAPSMVLTETLSRMDSFDLTESEAAKILLIDAVFLEVVPRHPLLKVWKTKALESNLLTGFADFLIAPKRAFMKSPLLCVAEAKKDDFEQGQAQCIAEMVACRWNNAQAGIRRSVYGIVTNGTGWQFFCLNEQNAVLRSGLYSDKDLPDLLGAVDYVCGECAKNVVL
ncbi:MAG: hypothetical protein H7Y38_09830 [Armatimonadetes bacterium]|nr:hypothetical protein [Armatimonadota bacterium]